MARLNYPPPAEASKLARARWPPFVVLGQMRNTKKVMRPRKTTGTSGMKIATAQWKRRRAGSTSILTTPVQTIWTTTAPGAKHPITGRSGHPIKGQTGLPTATAIGSGNRITVGLGCRMSLGAGPPITMAAGSNTAVRGAGGRGLSMPDMNQYGRLHMFPSSDMALADSASTLASDLVSGISAGSRSGHAIRSSPGGDGAAASDLVSSASTTSIGSAGADVIGMISTTDSQAGVVRSLSGLMSGSPISARLRIIRAFSTAYPRSTRINSGTALS